MNHFLVRKNNFFVTLFLIVSYTTIGQANLKYSLEVNDNFILQQDVVQTITQDIQGTTQEIGNELKGTLNFTVKEKTKETITLDISFTGFSMKMSSPGLGTLMEVDTESEIQTPESKMFKGIIGSIITIIIDHSGKLIDIQNGDAFINNMIAEMGITDESIIAQMKSQLGKDWGGESLGKSFEQVFFNYPNNPKTNLGDSWKNTFEAKNGLSANNTWTLDAIENNTYKISCIADITAKMDNNQITMNLTGTQQTELIADASNGLLIKLTITSTSEGSGTSKVMADLKIPTKIISTTTYTRL